MSRAALTARGQVQGVGFRPFLARLAARLGLTGTACNTPAGVRIEVQGPEDALAAFADQTRQAPAPIQVTALASVPLPTVEGEVGFVILPSPLGGSRRPVLSPDLATCPRCLAELQDPADRRHGYALLSCTDCGPRYTITEALPLDRERTTLAEFPLCPDCAAEYRDPADRRFHAQTVACARCGPRVRLGTKAGTGAIEAAVEILCGGGILAVKGLGGFQLMVDGRDAEAVARLRILKGRPDKPLAVMLRQPPAGATPDERRLLSDPAAPIVLLTAEVPLAPPVQRGRAQIGAMLPTTGLHHALIAAHGGPLVCTSGNRSGQPLSTTGPGVDGVDGVLTHDRAIRRPADDSVVRIIRGTRHVLRRARGLVPAPLPLPGGPPVLAVGAHLDVTVGLALGEQAILSPHIGDLDSRATLERFTDQLDALLSLYGATPAAIACDAHPDYPSTRHAEHLAARLGVPLRRIRHHHAHIAAVLAEHGAGDALGFAWDGTGLGDDGSTWGSESIRLAGSAAAPIAALRPFLLPGGDLAARSPARCALALLEAIGEDTTAAAEDAAPGSGRLLQQAVGSGTGCTPCRSMGRLFDAVAWLSGWRGPTRYSGQAAVWLEEQAGPWLGRVSPYPLPLVDGQLDWRPMITAILSEDAPAGRRAARLHLALIAAMVEVAGQVRAPAVVLSGGCFFNAILLGRGRAALQAAGHTVLTAERVPTGDGGIALGQLWLARR